MGGDLQRHPGALRGRARADLPRRRPAGDHDLGAVRIDIALWDLLGKSLGQPVWRLLGGRLRERIPAYASGGWAPVGGVGKQLRQYVERGHRAVKMRVGCKTRAWTTPRPACGRPARASAPRWADGRRPRHLVRARGQRFARKVADCDLGWLEEPVSPDNVTGQAEVRAATDIPIAAGETEQTQQVTRNQEPGTYCSPWN